MIHIRALLVTAVLTSALAGIGVASSTTGSTTQPGENERHPEIHKALHGLREAKYALTDAKHDYEGHRQAALDATEVAIKECEKCLEIDKK